MSLPKQLGTLRQDVGFAWRTASRQRGFTAVVILVLALCIGANTAIFTCLNVVMLRLLPVRDPKQLVEVLSIYPGEPPGSWFSLKSYRRLRKDNHVFTDLIATSSVHFEVSGTDIPPETVDGDYVTGNFFPALGVGATVGRLIAPQDIQSGSPGTRAAVLSWSYWNTRFHSDPAIVGKRMVIGDIPAVVIGVAPRDFFGLQMGASPALWVPMIDSSVGLRLMGRLKSGVSVPKARAEMRVLDRERIEELAKRSADPLIRKIQIDVEPAATGFSLLRNYFAKPLMLLMALAGLLLMLACSSFATMLLAREETRRKEMALRVALGAGRWRLMQQVLTESMLLSLVSGLFGIVLAYFLADGLMRVVESGRRIPGFPAHLAITIEPDLNVLAFTAGAVLFTGILFGVAPAWKAFRLQPASLLQTVGLRKKAINHINTGAGLTPVQIALSLVLLSTASLFVENLHNLRNIDLGFRRDHLLLVTIDPAHNAYTPEQLRLLYRDLLDRLQTIPGVRSATFSAALPISGAGISRFVNVEGIAEDPARRRYSAVNIVAPKYFGTLGTPVIAGRDFNDQDATRAPVAIVNAAMAARYFAGKNPVGRIITLHGENTRYEVVGVVGNAKYYDVREVPPSTIYLNALQTSDTHFKVVLWTSVKPKSLTNDVQQTIQAVLRAKPITKIITMNNEIDASLLLDRVIAMLSEVFGGLGAIIAAISLYGLLSYTVAQRTREIGIRLALGATRGDVMRFILLDVPKITSAGLCIGIPAAYWSTKLAQNNLADLQAHEGVSVIAGLLGIITIALLAAYLPTHRASRIDPIQTLRHE